MLPHSYLIKMWSIFWFPCILYLLNVQEISTHYLAYNSVSDIQDPKVLNSKERLLKESLDALPHYLLDEPESLYHNDRKTKGVEDALEIARCGCGGHKSSRSTELLSQYVVNLLRTNLNEEFETSDVENALEIARCGCGGHKSSVSSDVLSPLVLRLLRTHFNGELALNEVKNVLESARCGCGGHKSSVSSDVLSDVVSKLLRTHFKKDDQDLELSQKYREKRYENKTKGKELFYVIVQRDDQADSLESSTERDELDELLHNSKYKDTLIVVCAKDNCKNLDTEKRNILRQNSRRGIVNNYEVKTLNEILDNNKQVDLLKNLVDFAYTQFNTKNAKTNKLANKIAAVKYFLQNVQTKGTNKVDLSNLDKHIEDLVYDEDSTRILAYDKGPNRESLKTELEPLKVKKSVHFAKPAVVSNGLWRRSLDNQQKYGVPFEIEIEGLGQVNKL